MPACIILQPASPWAPSALSQGVISGNYLVSIRKSLIKPPLNWEPFLFADKITQWKSPLCLRLIIYHYSTTGNQDPRGCSGGSKVTTGVLHWEVTSLDQLRGKRGRQIVIGGSGWMQKLRKKEGRKQFFFFTKWGGNQRSFWSLLLKTVMSKNKNHLPDLT